MPDGSGAKPDPLTLDDGCCLQHIRRAGLIRCLSLLLPVALLGDSSAECASLAALAADEALRQAPPGDDETALRLWFGAQRPPASEQSTDEKKRAKEMSAQKKALAKALTRQAQAHAELGDRTASVEATLHARPWVDGSDATKTALTNLLIEWHREHHRYGQALQAVRQQIEQLGHGTSESLADLHRAQDLEKALLAQLEWDVWHHYAERWLWLRRPKAPEPF